MNELLRWETNEGSVVVEVDDADPGGFRSASLSADEVVYQAKQRFETALEGVRDAAVKALAAFRHAALDPDGVEIAFGVKFNAEVGAVIAKAATEAHLTVTLSWARDRPGSNQ
ncbi:hypothetical protein J5X84_42650 [Streptosporangiaceae bacterium NEAU-GS5]|nr:hypothetical protein [Streptosporangiaceae bacterium NEAU-GS5]